MDGKITKKRKLDSPPVVKNAVELMGYVQKGRAIADEPTPGENLSERLNKINDVLSVLYDIRAFLNTRPAVVWGSYKDPYNRKAPPQGFTTRIALSKVEEQIDRLSELYDETDLLRKSQLSLAATTMKPKSGESAGDGNCYIQVVNIGQGDCTTIATPDGLLIMVDMGSDSMTDINVAWPISGPPSDSNKVNEVVIPMLVDTIRRDIFLQSSTRVHMLILTHTDSDHHNRLNLLGDDIKFDRVYYGCDNFTGYYPTSNFISERTTKGGIKKVELNPAPFKFDNSPQQLINGVTPPTRASSSNPGGYDAEYVDSTTKAIVLYEETNGFKISILAGNVTGVYIPDGKFSKFISNDAVIKMNPLEKNFKREASEPNKRSLVVLVEFNEQKAIITGDATAVTEYFMVSQPGYADLFENVDMYRLPHHGSPTSSSLAMISKLTGLKEAVGSCSGKYTVLHRLPQQGILSLYAPPENVDSHLIWTFETELESGSKTAMSFKRKTYGTGSNNSRYYKFAKP